jgi:uncharacterized membrane protein YdjX (TVP38/TMEM64 family)
MSPRTLRAVRVVAVMTVLAGMAVAYRAGILAQLSDPGRARSALLALGPRGYAVFIVAYAALQPFGVPGTVFILAAPLVWPWPVAFVLSMIGTTAASVVGFSFARFVARDWLRTRIPARFLAYESRLERDGFVTVFTLRLLFWMPPLLHAFFGVSRVSFSTHLVGSVFGYVPPLLLVSYFGQRFFDAMRAAPAWAWVALGLATIAGFALFAWLRRRRASVEPPSSMIELDER